MRRCLFLFIALVLTFALPRAPRAETLLVAQLASGAAPSAPRVRALERVARPAAPDAMAIARATPALAELGVTVRRALLASVPAPKAGAAPGAPVAGLALDRVVLLAVDADAGATAQALVDRGLVDWVEPLFVRAAPDEVIGSIVAPGGAPFAAATLDTLPDDSLLRDTYQWGLYNVGAAGGAVYGGVPRADAHAIEGWRISVGNDAVKLAVADSGIDPDQPELGGLLRDGTPRIVDAINVTGEPVPAVTDSFGHGTLVAGVMAARTNDGPHFSGRGFAGVCGGDGHTTDGCRIVPIKISPGHSGEASSLDIAAAIVHATDVGARAMNLSYAGPGSSRIERLALTYAITHGCVAVVSAGNNGGRAWPDQPMYPGAYSVDGLCMEVGASEWNDARTRFSSYGPGVDLVAPGENIWTTFMTYPSYYGATYDGYVPTSGTSFSAPFVSGAIGLLAAARPELTDTDFQHVLRESAQDIGDPGVDVKTGWGRLDIGRALEAVGPGIAIWHDEVVADQLVPDTTTALLRIGEKGPGTLDRYTGSLLARRWAALATVTLPDSFADSARVWLRVGGTMAVRGDYSLPYFTPTAQVIARTARTFTLRGWVYHLAPDTCATCEDDWIPLPPSSLRFGFTVLGPRRTGPHVGAPTDPRALALAAGPNPFAGSLAVRAPAAGRLAVLDAAGRVLRAFDVGAGETRWDGRDDAGRTAPPGLYFVRWSGAGATRVVRVVRLGS